MRLKITGKISIFIFFILFMLLSSQTLFAYLVSDWMRPTNLTITIVVDTTPIHSLFTRYLCFYSGSNRKDVAVYFEPHPTEPDTWVGEVTATGLDVLEGMAEHNQRSYWDTMYFENHGGSTALDIATMEIVVTYGGHAGDWEPDILIGYVTNEYLDSGTDSFYVSGQIGRRKYVMDKYGWSLTTYFDLPDPIRWFCYDLGKTSSSDGTDSSDPNNHKYGITDNSGALLCSETVSWYYYEYNVRVTDQWYSPGTIYDFRDIEGAKAMMNRFHRGNLRYNYHSSRNEWIKVDSSGNWDYDDSIIPSPGDYLCRIDGSDSDDYEHSMMMLHWDPANGEAYVIDGPYPNAIRWVDVDAQEATNTHDFAIGRLPENKSWKTGNEYITQSDSDYWKSVSLPYFMNSPIVIMGPPTYEGSHDSTIRVRNVTPSGFEFQLDEWNYLDGAHTEESVNYLVFDEGIQTINGMQVEAGKVVTDENWKTVSINSNPGSTPVVLAQCASYDGSDAVTVRIRNVTTSSFDVRLQEEEALGAHCDELIHYVVIEPGIYGNFEVKLENNVTDSWKTITGRSGGGLSGPYFMANIQTFAGSDPATLRKDHVTGTDYRIKIEEEESEDSETSHTDETVGIVAYYYIIM